VRAQTAGAMESIRRSYGVPVYRGMPVKYEGHPAVITSAIRNTYLRLRFPKDSPMYSYRGCVFHPLWEIDYLDDVDYVARYEQREEAFRRTLNGDSAASSEPVGGKD
jgi:hypothetical protein